jgi:hypothetical protein
MASKRKKNDTAGGTSSDASVRQTLSLQTRTLSLIKLNFRALQQKRKKWHQNLKSLSFIALPDPSLNARATRSSPS